MCGMTDMKSPTVIIILLQAYLISALLRFGDFHLGILRLDICKHCSQLALKEIDKQLVQRTCRRDVFVCLPMSGFFSNYLLCLGRNRIQVFNITIIGLINFGTIVFSKFFFSVIV